MKSYGGQTFLLSLVLCYCKSNRSFYLLCQTFFLFVIKKEKPYSVLIVNVLYVNGTLLSLILIQKKNVSMTICALL